MRGSWPSLRVNDVGLVLNDVHLFLGTPTVTSGGIQKIAICDQSGFYCADIGDSILSSKGLTVRVNY